MWTSRVDVSRPKLCLQCSSSIVICFYLNTDGEIVFLDPFEVQRIVDLDVSVSGAVLMPGLEVERVVFVGLVRRSADQVVEHRGVVLDARAVISEREEG